MPEQMHDKITSVVDDEKLYAYVQFQPTKTRFFNTQGKPVEYTRCARTELKALLNDMQRLLIEGGIGYLQHCFFVSLDKAFWLRFKSECLCPIIHIDYSENIQLTPKNEVQSAHYSGRQHTLHCSVLFNNNEPGDHEFLNMVRI